MKKLFLLLMLLPFLSNAQYFNLTENGFVPAIGDNAKFIVIDKAGQTQEELFNQVKSYITASYVSPKDVLSENGTEMITLNGVSDGDVQCKKGFVMLPFRTNYTIVFLFKDGRIRINCPIINSILAESYTLGGQLSGSYQLTLTKNDDVLGGREQIAVFKGKGKTTKGAKESIEKYFNSLIENIVNYNPSEEEW